MMEIDRGITAEELMRKIEQVREQMYQVAQKNEMDLQAEEVLSISRMLDWMIYKVQRKTFTSWKQEQKYNKKNDNA